MMKQSCVARIAAVGLVMAVGSSSAIAQSKPKTETPDRFAVFVTAPTRDGFVDTTKDIQDSIKDIRTRLNDMKEMMAVDKPEGADIVLTVVARGVGSEVFGQRVAMTQYYGTAVLTNTPIVANTRWVSAVMDVGKYRKEFMGSFTNQSAYSLGSWTECSAQIAKDLRSWAIANTAQLKARRKTS